MPVSPIAIQAGLVMPGASAYALAAASLTPVVQLPYEPLASYDWIFGADYPDISDLVSGTKLQPAITLGITAGGTGYEATGALVFSGGGATQQATGIWFATGGVIVGAYVTDHGVGYTSSPAVAATTSTGTGATFTASLGAKGTLGANSITLAGGPGRGLVTPVPDSNDQTTCAVIKVITAPGGTNAGVVFGTLFSATNATGGVNAGSGIFLQGSSGYNTTVRPNAAVLTDEPAQVANGAYAFVALSEAPSGAKITYWGGPVPQVYTGNTNKNVLAAPPKIALGQAYYAAGNTGFQLEVAEFITIPRATTQAELDAVYARSKARMAERNLAVY